jgi:hypothetical protein
MEQEQDTRYDRLLIDASMTSKARLEEEVPYWTIDIRLQPSEPNADSGCWEAEEVNQQQNLRLEQGHNLQDQVHLGRFESCAQSGLFH